MGQVCITVMSLIHEDWNPDERNNDWPNDFAEHFYHVGSSHDMHSVIQSGLIPGGKDVKKGRRAVFLTAVNPMYIDHNRQKDYDTTKPRIAVYRHNWKVHQKPQCIGVI